YQQPVPGQARPQQPYQTAYQQPAPGAYSTAYQPSPYQRQGYPYQVNGVPQQAQPPVYSQYMQPVPPPQQYQPATHVDVDGVGRLIVYLALPVLAVLFVVGMAVSGLAWMKWLFTGLAAVVALMLWVRPLLRDDIKITLSCVLGALAVVAVVSALSSAPADAKQPAAQSTANVLSQPSVTPDFYAGIASGVEATPAPVVPTAAPASSGMQSEAVERMESFLYFWSVNNLDSMITLCAPSWVKKQDKPMESLYRILANRTPTEYNATAISGTDNDLSRTITVSISLHRNNGNAPKTYQFKVIMVREEEMWYLDPASLESNEEATATPASAVITQMPTPAPIADANQLLFYNPDGGSYYHLDAYCKSANARNLPFKGSFTYGQLNDAAYVNLISCPVCAAPKRPAKN
ncbi:MAG: hypothetical protein Q4E72_11095, partial [bacterium]|nr:hypothetical protein [bacterium]